MKRRLGSSFILVLIIFSSLLTGLTGCKDLLVQKQVEGFAVSFVTPGTSSSRSADGGGANWNVTAWLELEDGTTLQSQKTTAVAGEPVSIAFEPVAAGTRLRVKVELVSATDSSVKYSGTSNLIEVIPGENSVSLELSPVDAEPEEDTPPPDSEEEEKEEPVIVNAEVPKIETQPVGEIKPAAAGQATTVTKELTVKASISDGGNLTYQWYSNNTNSTEGGTKIEGATSSSYEATVAAKETKYFYCVVTNTNNSATGAKTASTTTNVVAVASVEGELTSITAKYTGSQGYMLVGQINYSDFTVTETYTSGTETVDVTVTPDTSSYTIAAKNNDSSEAIGHVPYTVTHNASQKTDELAVLTKYELSSSYLKIEGSTSVEQGNELKLTGQYKGDDGNDVQYKLYDESGSSNTYKVIEKVSIVWTGAAQQPNKWEALAETNTAGSKTATVKLSAGDDWCVTTEISKVFPYTVTGFLGSQTNPVLNWTDLKSLVESNNRQNPIYVSGTMDATEVITVVDSVEIIAVASTTINRATSHIELLFDSAAALTFTGSSTAPIIFAGNNINASTPMISAEANLTMTYCTMQNNVNTSTSGGGAILVKSGTLTLDHCTFTGNKTTGNSSPGGAIYMTTQNTKKLIATNTTFQSNGTEGTYSNGGAISFENNTESNILNNCTFISNSVSNSGRGAGVYVYTQAKVVLNRISMSENTIAPADTSQSATQEDIYMNNAPHLTLAGQLTIPTMCWNRGDNSYTRVFTAGYETDAFADTSSIGLTISGTIPTGTLQLFIDNTTLTESQTQCFTANGQNYSVTTSGVVEFTTQ